MNDSVSKLVSYYSANGKPDTLLLDKTDKVLAKYNQTRIDEVVDWLMSNVPRQDGKYRHDLSMTDVYKAINETNEGGYYIPAVDHRCAACNLVFKYAMCVDWEDKIKKGIHDYCPRCGFDPEYTFRVEKDRSSLTLERYEMAKERALRNFQQREKTSKQPWIFNKDEDLKYVEDQKQAKIDAMKASVADEVATLATAKVSDGHIITIGEPVSGLF